MFCVVGFLPAMRRAGSPPGMTMKMTKVRKLTAAQHEHHAHEAADEEDDHGARPA